MELLLLWVWLQKALPRHIAPGFPPCMSISKTFCLDEKLQGKVIPWEDHAWVTEQPTALLKELASKRGAQCEVHLVPGKVESRSIHLFINCLALGSKPYLTGKEKTWQPKEPPSPLCGSRKGKGEIVTDQIQGQDNGSITSTLCANT